MTQLVSDPTPTGGDLKVNGLRLHYLACGGEGTLIVIVHATGTGFEPLQGIAHPIELQNQITRVGSKNRDAPPAMSSRQIETRG